MHSARTDAAFLSAICYHFRQSGSLLDPAHAKDATRCALAMRRDCIEREGVKNPRVLQSMRRFPARVFVLQAMKKQGYHIRPRHRREADRFRRRSSSPT